MKIPGPSRLLTLFTVTIALLLPTANANPISTITKNLTENPLSKRGCFVSKQVTEDLPLCDTLSVDYFKTLILDEGVLPNRDCLFYLNLGGSNGQQLAQQWYCAKRNTGRGSVVWGTAVGRTMSSDLFNELFGKEGPDPVGGQMTDLFGVAASLLSQAMGETCNGNVYFFTPQGSDWTQPPANVWLQYEYPALTRNSQVSSILRVDPTIKDSNGNFADDGVYMWTPASGPSANAPAGDGYSYTYS